MIQKTVEDEPCHKLADLGIYEPQTPQHIKTQKQDMIKGRKNDDVNSFQMEDSFENKHLTVKRQYIAEPYELQKEDITLKDKSDNNQKKRNKAVNKDRLEIQ